MRRITKQRRQQGTMLVLVAAGAVALLGAGALAVDIGYFFTVRNQMQNAADAAAIAAAQGLIADPGNFSDNGTAKQWAIQIAAKNKAAGQPVTLSPSDITFPSGNVVQVRINKTVPTFLGKVLGVAQVNLRVAAAAVPSRGVKGGPMGDGLRPWTIPDQFAHGGLCVPANDCEVNITPHGEFKDYPHTWNGFPVNSDYYKSPYDEDFEGVDLTNMDCGTVTGYISPRDVNGELITLKEFKYCDSGSGGNGKGNGKGGSSSENPWRTPGNFGAIALGGNGASVYRSNIANGYQGLVSIGDILTTEPGVNNGPTIQGVAELILKDPGAHMMRNDAGKWVVISPKYRINESPRIVPIPLYSVYDPPGNGRSTFTVSSIASFFIEGTDGKSVWGRFVHIRIRNGEEAGEPPHSNSNTVAGGGPMINTARMVDIDE